MDKLISIWNDRGFVLAVSCSIETDEEAQKMLDFINSDETLTTDDITIEALHIAQERDNQQI